MPDMNENAETQQEYFGKVRTDNTETLKNALNKITELEKQIEELREDNEACYKENEGLVKQYNELFEKNRELQKENEMLKQGYVWHDYDAGEDCYEDSHEGRWVKRDGIAELEQQLTEAKEIIRELLSLPYANDWEVYAPVSKYLSKAEAFLKG